ncbi:MAG: glycine betaine ABC transporter substrate-binding protein, partial [Nakamurella sp.]
NGFVVLKDPKNLFLAQNIVPLIAKSAATPEVTAVLNAVSTKLTTEGLTGMLKTIGATKADPADIATKWVADNGLS